MTDIHEGNCRLRFAGIGLTISARRIWEHIRQRQINPFEAITARNANHPDTFVDVVILEIFFFLAGMSLGYRSGRNISQLPVNLPHKTIPIHPVVLYMYSPQACLVANRR